MKKKHKTYFKKFVFIFGFLNGFWLAIGFDPRKEVIGLIFRYQEFFNPMIIFLFGILPTIILLTMLYLSYQKAKFMGIGAVIFGFISGMLILTIPIVSIILLIIAYILTLISVKK
jgi:hypothetical protein